MTITKPSSKSSSKIFSKYTLETYGKGYLLRPRKGDSNWGMKYFVIDGGEGWWNAGQNAWFFQSKHYDFLVSNGARISSSASKTQQKSTQTRRSKRVKFQKLNELADRLLKSKSSRSSEPIFDEEHYVSEEDSDYVPPEVEESEEEYVPDVEEDEGEVDFTNYTVRAYKRGYLLVPPRGDENWGEKYFHDGWWMPTQDAWFFRSKFYNFLLNSGARDEASPSPSSSGLMFENYTVTPYKRGFLLVPEEGDENWGAKYFHDGWWMPSQDAWFFRSKFYDFLVENGARSSDDEPVSAGICSGMSLEPYGRGYLLSPSKSHPSYAKKYFFEDTKLGWWMPVQMGWFFKSDMVDQLVSEGALLI